MEQLSVSIRRTALKPYAQTYRTARARVRARVRVRRSATASGHTLALCWVLHNRTETHDHVEYLEIGQPRNKSGSARHWQWQPLWQREASKGTLRDWNRRHDADSVF